MTSCTGLTPAAVPSDSPALGATGRGPECPHAVPRVPQAWWRRRGGAGRGGSAAVVGQTEYMLIDQQELPNGPFTYYVVADFGAVTSDESNNVTITAVNDAPVATNDSYSTD